LGYDDGMKKLLIANWKSHKTLSEVSAWMDSFESKFSKSLLAKHVDIAIAPTEAYLAQFSNEMHAELSLAAQDVSPFPVGKYTGATAASQLASLGVKYAIVGHSERRRYFSEDNTQVANKVRQCVEAGIIPIVCVDDEYVSTQAAAIDSEYHSKCIIAYEALSAIGSGNNMDAAHVAEVTKLINDVFGEVPVLYGGSVNAGNVAEYAEISDGWLVGTASLKVDDFWALALAVSNL